MAKVERVRAVTLSLTDDEARKLGGLIGSIGTADQFFGDLYELIDEQYPDFLPMFEQDADGVYVQKEEE